MRRLLVIAMATALFLSVAVGIAGALDPDAWFGSAKGHMVATDPGHDGLQIRLSFETDPKELNWTKADGRGYYGYDGNAFRLEVSHACVDPVWNTVTVWGQAEVKSGSFLVKKTIGVQPTDDYEWVTLSRGDEGYAVLSLLDEGNNIVSARAGISADFFAGGHTEDIMTLPLMIAQQCEYPESADWAFPATGHGKLMLKADVDD